MAALLARLSLTRQHFPSLTAGEMLPLEQEAEILQAAAEALYPGDPQGLQKLGEEVAKINFSGIYKPFLMIASPEFIAKRIAGIWKTFYDQGGAHVENFHGKSGTVVATGLPELTSVQRRYICGYMAGVLHLTAVKNIQVVVQEQDPQAWRWLISWT